MDIVSELKPIGQLSTCGAYRAALTELERLWNSVPLPKETSSNSYLIVAYGISIALKANCLDEAWVWAERGLPYSGNRNLGGESEFSAGKVAFARSDFETATKFFKAARKMSGWR